MYVEERMYQLQPGKVPEYFKRYENEGMAIQFFVARLIKMLAAAK